MYQKLTLVVAPRRSGATWLCTMLGMARNTLYLDEPDNPALYDERGIPLWALRDHLCGLRPEHDKYLFNLMKGLIEEKYWAEHQDIHDNVIMKFVEVELLEQYIPHLEPYYILYITRHPLAMMNSYQNLDWDELFFKEYLRACLVYRDRWPYLSYVRSATARFVALTHVREEYAKAVAAMINRNYPGTMMTVQYEDAVFFPEKTFAQVADFCGMQLKEDFADRLKEYMEPEVSDTFWRGTKKNSKDVAVAWRNGLTKEQQNAGFEYIKKYGLREDWLWQNFRGKYGTET